MTSLVGIESHRLLQHHRCRFTCMRQPLLHSIECRTLRHVLFYTTRLDCWSHITSSLRQLHWLGYRSSSVSSSRSWCSCTKSPPNDVRHTLPTSSASARQTHSDDLCVQHRPVQTDVVRPTRTDLRRLIADLVLTYKIIFGLVDLNMSDFFSFQSSNGYSTTTRGNPYKLFVNHLSLIHISEPTRPY